MWGTNQIYENYPHQLVASLFCLTLQKQKCDNNCLFQDILDPDISHFTSLIKYSIFYILFLPFAHAGKTNNVFTAKTIKSKLIWLDLTSEDLHISPDIPPISPYFHIIILIFVLALEIWTAVSGRAVSAKSVIAGGNPGIPAKLACGKKHNT